MSDIRDENDRLMGGDLPADPLADAHPMVDGDVAPVPYIVPEQITEHARLIIEGHRNRRAHYLGRGKTRSGERTPEAYDMTVAFEVLDNGGTLADAAGALMDRPDRHARGRGEAYIRDVITRTVAELEHVQQKLREAAEEEKRLADDREREKAERRAAEAKEQVLRQRALEKAKIEMSIRIARESTEFGPVRIYATSPPVYVFTVNGAEIEMTAEDAFSSRRFKMKCFERLHRLVTLPTKSEAWDQLINGLLGEAEVIHEAAEASPAEIMEEEIEEALSEMPVAEHDESGDLEAAAQDLKSGLLMMGGFMWVCGLDLRRKVSAHIKLFDPRLMAATLRAQGWRPVRFHGGGQQFRAWRRPLDPPEQAAA